MQNTWVGSTWQCCFEIPLAYLPGGKPILLVKKSHFEHLFENFIVGLADITSFTKFIRGGQIGLHSVLNIFCEKMSKDRILHR